MKKLNLRSITAIVAIAIASISYVLMSFGTEEKVQSQTLKYRYNLSSAAGLENSSNWTDVSDQPNPTGCEQDQPLPCLVEFSDEDFSNLEEFLDEYDNHTAIMGSGYVKATKPIL